ncbi:hypothetical protein PM082_014832 [Marasmius tenuissimus]|nr:hypothetical protein PM082_014832 [Marasmius tenuissimus]
MAIRSIILFSEKRRSTPSLTISGISNAVISTGLGIFARFERAVDVFGGGESAGAHANGRDARKAFREEFLKLSRILSTEASQVYAIQNGTIPSMVLWHNLLPLAQFKENVRGLGLLYLESLRRQLGCDDEELWMDSSRGVICRGPKGPDSSIPADRFQLKDLPSTAELLQEEVLVRFLASHKSKEADDAFMDAMNYARNYEVVPERVDRPTIFSTQTKTPIAVANNAWKSLEDTLVERTCLENGLTRCVPQKS